MQTRTVLVSHADMNCPKVSTVQKFHADTNCPRVSAVPEFHADTNRPRVLCRHELSQSLNCPRVSCRHELSRGLMQIRSVPESHADTIRYSSQGKGCLRQQREGLLNKQILSPVLSGKQNKQLRQKLFTFGRVFGYGGRWTYLWAERQGWLRH